MKDVTHAYCVNGRTWMEVPPDRAEAEGQVRGLLSRLDGGRTYSIVLSRLPSGKGLDEVDIDRDLLNCLQCAGRADRMVIEISRVVAGLRRQYAIGHGSSSGESDPARAVEVEWSDFTVKAFGHELFDAVEASEIFLYYLDRDEAPPACVLRELLMSAENN